MVKQELGLAQRFNIKYSKFNIKNSDRIKIKMSAFFTIP
jgi:hypothetical protein